jgi:hypothetical protein
MNAGLHGHPFLPGPLKYGVIVAKHSGIGFTFIGGVLPQWSGDECIQQHGSRLVEN